MINIGIIGIGFVASLHIAAYKKMNDVRIKALCDNDIEKLKVLEKDIKDVSIYTDIEELVKDKDIDVVVICTPSFLHYECIKICIKYKKNIFCEKPLALSLKESEEIIDEVNKNNLNMMVGHVIRFWPEYIIIKDYIDNNRLGQIKGVYATRLCQMPSWNIWNTDPKYSGGALYDLHIHDIDFINYVFGKPRDIVARGYHNEKYAWNNVSSMLTYDNFCANIEGSNQMSLGYPFTMTMHVVGTDASIEYIFKAGENLEDINSSKRELIFYKNGDNAKKLDVEYFDAYENEFLYYIDCLKNNKKIELVSLESVRDTMKIIDSIEKSLNTFKYI